MKAKELAEKLLQYPDYDVACLEERSFFPQNEAYTWIVDVTDGNFNINNENKIIVIGK